MHQRDEHGQIVRSITRTEPLWLPEDRAAVLALIDDEARRCPGCGRHEDDCLDESDDPKSFVIGVHHCRACRAREEFLAKHTPTPPGQERRKPDPAAWTYHLPFTTDEARQLQEGGDHG